MISKSENNQLKFSIRNLIETTATTSSSCEKTEKSKSNSIVNRSLKNMTAESDITSSSSSLMSHPIPLVKPKVPPHPCWSFLSQFANKNSHGTLPISSSLLFLNKMNQVWQQMQRAQISPSITTVTSSTTENDDVSDEDTCMDTSSSSIRRHNELDDEDDEEIEDDEDDEEEEGECTTSTGDGKHDTALNSEENDKLKNYPCTQCGKVIEKFFVNRLMIYFQLGIYCSIQFSSTYASAYRHSSIYLQGLFEEVYRMICKRFL